MVLNIMGKSFMPAESSTDGMASAAGSGQFCTLYCGGIDQTLLAVNAMRGYSQKIASHGMSEKRSVQRETR